MVYYDVCPNCGEEVTYEFDPRTGKHTKLTKCECDEAREKVKELQKKLKDLKTKHAKARKELEKAIKVIEEWNKGRLKSIGKAYEHVLKAYELLR